MGNYMGKDNRKTLTALAEKTPGPSDYTPDPTKVMSSGAEWSMVGKPTELRVPAGPGPTNYKTEVNMAWSDKTVTLKQKGKTCPLGPRHDVHVTDSLGPGTYLVQHGDTGRHAPKFTMGHSMTPAGAALGQVGRDAPGPTFLGHTDRGKSFSLGGKLHASSETAGPGPGTYAAPPSDRGHEASMAGKLDNELASSTNITLPRFFGWDVGHTPFRKLDVEDSPGAVYDIPSTVGDGPSKSIAWRQSIHIGKEGKAPAWPDSTRRAPTPGAYTTKFTNKPSYPKHSMGYSVIEQTDPMEPGPGKYQGMMKDKPKKAYSFGMKSKPTFPHILNYVEHSANRNNTGPTFYKGPSDFSKNSGQKAVIGGRLKEKQCTVPAPNRYTPHKTKNHVPEFSITSRIRVNDDNKVPGPGSYNPDEGHKTPRYTMSGRPRPRRVDVTPGPNAYSIKPGQTHKTMKSGSGGGVTMKGRPSPFVYSGFRNTARSSTLVS